MKQGDRFVSDGHPQSALRELRAHFQHPVVVTALLCVGAVLGVAGPFGTDQLLGFAARMIYWIVMVFLTYGVSTAVSRVVVPRMSGHPFAVMVIVIGLLSGAAVTMVVMVQNTIVFGSWLDGDEVLQFMATLFTITLIVTTALAVVSRHLDQKHVSPARPAPPALLERLPIDKRGPLIALSVEDHYVRIRTTKGEELVLLRLADAIREVGDTTGDQVHRSHWAAFDQVQSARREGDRAILTMRDGTEIPVSRANLPKIKEAGLLPR